MTVPYVQLKYSIAVLTSINATVGEGLLSFRSVCTLRLLEVKLRLNLTWKPDGVVAATLHG